MRTQPTTTRTSTQITTVANDNDGHPRPPAAALRMPIPDRQAEKALRELEAFLRRLPLLNRGVEYGTVSFSMSLLEREVAAHIDPQIIGPIVYSGHVDQELALRYLGLLGFAVSSLERHAQGAGRPAGSALAAMPGVERCLLELGRIANHPPRDSHYTYWLNNNSDDPLTFTGETGEKFFNFAVNQTDLLLGNAADYLLDIRIGALSLRDPQAVLCIEEAAASIAILRRVYLDYRRPVEGGTGARMTPLDFNRMRNYLLPYPVGGMMHSGPNATNVAAYPRVDLAIGWADEAFCATIAQRLSHMNDRDAALVRRDLGLPSLAERLLDLIGLRTEKGVSPTIEQLIDHIRQSGSDGRKVAHAYSLLVKEAHALSALHWGHISHYLVHGGKTIPAEMAATMPLKPHTGVSGSSLDRTHALMSGRSAHWTVTCLPKAVDRLTFAD
ncbi:monodechloroaminopyrrolnitrin synthase PrnB family protein [Azospirillum lipoferum]|uniref:Indoleamine 2,3-dioxygenase n=1 Tax=Azospirillum lipoferum (strain 4B) TaxID=862719 RepID=G7Z6M6_AZOL4|nr:monodechloroaminopyrrolnitrin synthase PrnB family protein [Azospirillum lipoferum]CBS88089.1 protein of unknown function [Azospirillum lipoferum 4B]